MAQKLFSGDKMEVKFILLEKNENTTSLQHLGSQCDANYGMPYTDYAVVLLAQR
jgi:hypothetical protein